MKGDYTTGGLGLLLAKRMMLSIGLIGLFIADVWGQRAPDIPRGASAESVIQRYGWPKGKGVADGRESWLYETFQVLFEDGRVVAVSYISPNKPPQAVGSSAGRRTPAAPVSPAIPTVTKPAPVTPVRPQSPPASDYLVRKPSALSTVVAVEPPKSSWSGEVLVGVIGGTILVALVIVWFRQKSSAQKLSDALISTPESAGAASTQRWEDHVAARLNQVNAAPARVTANVAITSSNTALITPPEPRVSRLTRELLLSLEWKRFEQIVALYFEAMGVDARCTCIGADGGVDVKLHRKGESKPYAYVQCKAWESEKIKITTMREFLGVMAADDIAEGVFVTTSDFWPDTRGFAEANGILPINGSNFIARFAALPANHQARILAVVTEGDYTTPTCVKCDRTMQARNRKRDGVRFWACACGHTLPARAAA